MSNNQLIVTAVVIVGIGALIWSTSQAQEELDPEEFALGDDTARETELAGIRKEFVDLQREMIPADITGHRLTAAEADKFKALGKRAEEFADTAEKDPGSEKRAREALEIMDRVNMYSSHVRAADMVAQVIPAEKPVPTVQAASLEPNPGFVVAPPRPALVLESDPEPQFNVATSNVDKVKPGHTTERSTSDRAGDADHVFSTAPKQAALSLGVSQDTEAHDDAQNKAGLNVPQAGVGLERFAEILDLTGTASPIDPSGVFDLPAVKSGSPAASFTTVAPEPESSEIREQSGFGPVKKGPSVPKGRTRDKPSFVSDPNAASEKDPTLNKFKAVRTEDDEAQDEFYKSLVGAVAASRPAELPEEHVSLLSYLLGVVKRLSVSQNKAEAHRLVQVFIRLQDRIVTAEDQLSWDRYKGIVDQEFRKKWGKSPIGSIAMGGARPPKRRRSRRSARLQSIQETGATKDV